MAVSPVRDGPGRPRRIADAPVERELGQERVLLSAAGRPAP
jgi:hypothetical protein